MALGSYGISDTQYMLVMGIALVILISVAVIFFILPEHRDRKRTNNLVQSLKAGQQIKTKTGIMGTVVRVDKEFVQIQTGRKNQEIQITRDSVEKIIN